MKKVLYMIILIFFTALIAVSCGSAPAAPAEPAPPAAETPAEPSVEPDTPPRVTPSPPSQQALSVDALNEPIARAQAARQRALDFESNTYFPSDWENIEARFAAANEMRRTSDSDIQSAAHAYNAVADAYDEIFKKTIALYAQAREDEILAARESLIQTGFTQYFPEYLKTADDLAISAQEQYEAGDFNAARDTAAAALNEYETLLLGASVFLVRQEIIYRGFVDYDRDNFLRTDEIAGTAIAYYEEGNKEAAVSRAEEAMLRYSVVLANSWTTFAEGRREAADAERELALAERVNIASREIFREAETIFQQAEREFDAGNFNNAASLFISSEARFHIGRMDTAERRQRAQAAIRTAEERIEEISETAQEAERIIEGGSR